MLDRPQSPSPSCATWACVGCSGTAPTYSHSIAISGDGWPDDLRLPEIEPLFVYRRASSLEIRPAQFLSVVVTDGLGAAAVNCPNGDDLFSSSSRKECTFASIAAFTLSEPRSLKSLC